MMGLGLSGNSTKGHEREQTLKCVLFTAIES